MIKKPWTKEHVDHLNSQQKRSDCHPYTCGGGHGVNVKCERQQVPMDWSKEGTLIATVDGWVCPCGDYKQDWSH